MHTTGSSFILVLKEEVEFSPLFLGIHSRERNTISYEVFSVHRVEPGEAQLSLLLRGITEISILVGISTLSFITRPWCDSIVKVRKVTLWDYKQCSLKCSFLNGWLDLRVNIRLSRWSGFTCSSGNTPWLEIISSFSWGPPNHSMSQCT